MAVINFFALKQYKDGVKKASQITILPIKNQVRPNCKVNKIVNKKFLNLLLKQFITKASYKIIGKKD